MIDLLLATALLAAVQIRSGLSLTLQWGGARALDRRDDSDDTSAVRLVTSSSKDAAFYGNPADRSRSSSAALELVDDRQDKVNHRVAFCFLVRNGERYLHINLNFITDIARKYADYRIFWVENDSTDGTRDILRTLQAQNPTRAAGEFLDGLGPESRSLCPEGPRRANCKERTQFLAGLRERLLRRALQWEDCDTFVMLDLDFVAARPNSFAEMQSVFDTHSADAVFAHSRMPNCTFLGVDLPYDIGAFGPQDSIVDVTYDYNGTHISKVTSAFSGFGMYRVSSIRKSKATYLSNEGGIEHIPFNSYFRDLLVYTGFRPTFSQDPYVCRFMQGHAAMRLLDRDSLAYPRVSAADFCQGYMNLQRSHCQNKINKVVFSPQQCNNMYQRCGQTTLNMCWCKHWKPAIL